MNAKVTFATAWALEQRERERIEALHRELDRQCDLARDNDRTDEKWVEANNKPEGARKNESQK
jgi:hypothetical protein